MVTLKITAGKDDDSRVMDTSTYVYNTILLDEGDWQLRAVGEYLRSAGNGWQSVILHACDLAGSPYWMLLEYHTTPTLCLYCSDPIPDGIVALFKFHNDRCIR
jgi:hypothetical protein